MGNIHKSATDTPYPHSGNDQGSLHSLLNILLNSASGTDPSDMRTQARSHLRLYGVYDLIDPASAI